MMRVDVVGVSFMSRHEESSRSMEDRIAWCRLVLRSDVFMIP